MKRRGLLLSLAGLSTVPAVTKIQGKTEGAGQNLANPYADVDWDKCDYLHSMSHQHQGQTDTSRDVFRGMGYRHFAFSNYYPSAPTYPLPPAYRARHPELLCAPNAEHHSFTDTGLHCNALGSLLATGFGSSLTAKERAAAPLLHTFEGLHIFDGSRPWLGMYRLDVRVAAKAPGQPPALLTVEGATECAFRENFADRGVILDRALAAGEHTIYLRTTASDLKAKLVYDPVQLTVTQFRLMQGTNRSWRDVFRAALDGETMDGQHNGGLLFPDGGGITLNHPTGTRDDYAVMLDFDPRVLGIEIWNQLTSGFGAEGGFYEHGAGPHIHFYRLWDELLRTGRRCWGFFVKDHNTFGRGRNVLLVPPSAGGPMAQRESDALRAYRTGTFFGSVAALATNETGELAAPYDRSEFRFSRLTLRRDADGLPIAIEVVVTGNDPAKRPNIQIRFVTDEGIASIVDAAHAEFLLQRDSAARLKPLFVRVEAFAYPQSHLLVEPLTAEKLRGLNVHEISQLHDRMANRGPNFFGNPQELRTPIPIVDMIFSQPLQRV